MISDQIDYSLEREKLAFEREKFHELRKDRRRFIMYGLASLLTIMYSIVFGTYIMIQNSSRAHSDRFLEEVTRELESASDAGSQSLFAIQSLGARLSRLEDDVVKLRAQLESEERTPSQDVNSTDDTNSTANAEEGAE